MFGPIFPVWGSVLPPSLIALGIVGFTAFLICLQFRLIDLPGSGLSTWFLYVSISLVTVVWAGFFGWLVFVPVFCFYVWMTVVPFTNKAPKRLMDFCISWNPANKERLEVSEGRLWTWKEWVSN